MLDVTKLENDLYNLFVQGSNNSRTMANRLASIIDEYVKTATVTSNGVTSPTVPGSPATITNLQGVIN